MMAPHAADILMSEAYVHQKPAASSDVNCLLASGSILR